MKTKNILIIAVAALIATILFYTFNGGSSDKDYLENLNKERQEKDQFMKSSEDSPFADGKKSFVGLNYFPPDEKYRISAKLVSIQNKKMRVLTTSDGLEKRYLEYAFAEFELNNTFCKLLVLEIVDDNQHRGTLFLAFSDSTSAHETYGAGRYLELKKIPGATSVTLDFNKSYNPYCAYSDNFSCPFPPLENNLKIAVRAGEKKYHD